MSGILKGIGKVFKKVVKTVVKVAPYALAAAAVVFTGGAALGILPTFAGAVGSVVGGLGLSGAAAGALTGAVTSAGFGAAAGGVLGGTKGMKKGMVMGALAGGALGAASPGMFGMGAAGAAAPGAVPATGGAASSGLAAVQSAGPIAAPMSGGMLSSAASAAPGLVSTAPAAGGFMGMLNGNPMLASSILQGVGGALGGDDQSDYLRDRDRRYADNYTFMGGGGMVDPTERPSPEERFSPASYQTGAPVYRTNEKTGRVEAVYPVGNA